MVATGESLDLFARREHAHLRLIAALPPLPRRKVPGGGGRGPKAPDNVSHGQQIRDQILDVRERNRHRLSVLGVSPENVLVIEFDRDVDPVLIEQAGLQLLGLVGRLAMAAFSSDPELTAFVRRCEQYAPPLPADRQAPSHYQLFDAIVLVRQLKPDDVVAADLMVEARRRAPNELIRVDIECWTPDQQLDTERRHQDLKDAVESAGGRVVNSSCRWIRGLSLIRAEVPAGRMMDIAHTDRVRRMTLLSQPVFRVSDLTTTSVDSLPIVETPRPDAPMVAVIDSGLRAGHPLLSAAVYEAVAVGSHFPDGSDEAGHGTFVASLALHGSLESTVRGRGPLRPAGRLLGIRVLDHHGVFPADRIWHDDLETAIRLAVASGARVINLSIGDNSQPYRPPAPEAVAAVVDALVREFDIVVVVSAGNFHWNEYPADDESIIDGFPWWLLNHEEAGLLPPATSALALTVGALVPDVEQGVLPAQESVDQRPMGQAGGASPVTRTGVGIEQMVKPELVAPGGTYSYDLGLHRVVASKSGLVVGAGGKRPDRLLETDLGTSYAAPLVSHAALRVLGRYPALSANAVKALLLASAQPVPESIVGGTPSKRADEHRRLAGYGRVSADRAEFSADHRAVLLAEGELETDSVHFYTTRVPRSFFEHGAKTIAVALAFDPEVRATRLAYLGSRMSVYAYRGLDVELVRAKFARLDQDTEAPDVPSRFKIDLQPANRRRLLGANQMGSVDYVGGWDAEYRDDDLVIVVRNTGRWAATGARQRYALAVVLETSERASPLYSELRATLDVLAEIESEIELGEA